MLSLYIHIPFCVGKCLYCGFYSTIYSKDAADAYASALKSEAGIYRSRFGVKRIKTVYLGGGTPSILSLYQLENVLNIIRDHFSISSDAEFTVEANPNSLTDDHLSLLKDQGVNRVSLGIQSFSDDILSFLGRPHSAAEGVGAFQRARRCGFANIGVDLIYGIPGQSEGQWRETLKNAIELAPEHISAYSLSLDDGSRFRRRAEAGLLALPPDESVAGQYELILNELEKTGYEQYEISNFSRPGFYCRHNLNYWQRGEYLGLGPGAWSFIGNRRYGNVADVVQYCERLQCGSSVIEEEDVTAGDESANETIMLACRTVAGLDLGVYEQLYGADRRRRLEQAAEVLVRSGVVEQSGMRLRLTGKGFLVANEVLGRLIL
jgi:oxygen-independent coproporphyrinogen-3 oxidase